MKHLNLILFLFFFLALTFNEGEAIETKDKQKNPEISVIVSGLFPPYYFKAPNGELSGMATEIVKSTLERASLPSKWTQESVARAIKIAQEQENVLIFTIFRTPEREKLFKWVAPITPKIKDVLFKLSKRSDINVRSIDDVKKFKVGVVRGNNIHTLLLNQGLKDGKELEPVVYNEQNIKKLFLGRIDLCAGRDLPFLTEMKQYGFQEKDVKEVDYVLHEDLGWMAFSLSTPDAVVERVKKAFKELKNLGTVESIFKKYQK